MGNNRIKGLVEKNWEMKVQECTRKKRDQGIWCFMREGKKTRERN